MHTRSAYLSKLSEEFPDQTREISEFETNQNNHKPASGRERLSSSVPRGSVPAGKNAKQPLRVQIKAHSIDQQNSNNIKSCIIGKFENCSPTLIHSV